MKDTSKKLLEAKERHTKALKRWVEAKKQHLAHPKNKKLKDAFENAAKKYQVAEDEYNERLGQAPKPKSKPSEKSDKKIYTRCDSILEALSEKKEWTKKDLVRRADDLYREHGGNSNKHISQVAMQYAVGYLKPLGFLDVVKSRVFVIKKQEGET